MAWPRGVESVLMGYALIAAVIFAFVFIGPRTTFRGARGVYRPLMTLTTDISLSTEGVRAGQRIWIPGQGANVVAAVLDDHHFVVSYPVLVPPDGRYFYFFSD